MRERIGAFIVPDSFLFLAHYMIYVFTYIIYVCHLLHIHTAIDLQDLACHVTRKV